MSDATKADNSMAKAKVFILYTGGTIGMAPQDPDRPESPLVPKDLSELIKYVPGLDNQGIAIDYDAFDTPLDSSDLSPDHWLDMAGRIEKVYDNYDGFVILHGTDTLAYTASALAFLFENLGKPIVITGSQLPISDVRTDAKLNFVNSIFIAGYKAVALPRIPEVVVVFADKILRGCCTRKVSSKALAGFRSPNCLPLGSIGEHIVINTGVLRPPPVDGQRLQRSSDISRNVIDTSLFPGFKPSHLRQLLELKDVDAVVLRTYGAGNAPQDKELFDVIADGTKRGKTIVNVTQCEEGMVEMGLYAASSGLLERGVISGLDMTPEAALTKLMWTLGTKIGDQVMTQMQVNQRGEQSENLFDLRYGSCGTMTEPEVVFRQYRTPDRRFNVDRLSRAVVRISALGLGNVPIDSMTKVRVFMNLPSADSKTPPSHSRCVAEIPIHWLGQPMNVAAQIEYTAAKSSIGESDVTLSVVAENGVQFWFGGLYLALFARA